MHIKQRPNIGTCKRSWEENGVTKEKSEKRKKQGEKEEEVDVHTRTGTRAGKRPRGLAL